jgi:hypothetical protein
VEEYILRTTVVGMEIRLQGPGFESWQKQEIFLFFKMSSQDLVAHSASYSMGSRVLSLN